MGRAELWAIIARAAVGAVLGASIVAPALAQTAAEPPSLRAIELTLKVGYGLPLGHTGHRTSLGNQPLSDVVSYLVPIEVGAGYRFNSRFVAGLSVQYAFASINDQVYPCLREDGLGCSSHGDLRVDANVILHLGSGGRFDPWVGVGAGYEWLLLTFQTGATRTDTLAGFEFANLQTGGYVKVAPGIAIGPFVGLSFGMYRTDSFGAFAPDMNPGMTTLITPRSLHEWLVFGVGGTHDIHF